MSRKEICKGLSTAGPVGEKRGVIITSVPFLFQVMKIFENGLVKTSPPYQKPLNHTLSIG